jgi:hypothetical protein
LLRGSIQNRADDKRGIPTIACMLFAVCLAGCEGTRNAIIALEDRSQLAAAMSEVDSYEVKASVFVGENFKPDERKQRHRLERVGPDTYVMTEAYSASTSAERAKAIARLGMAMHARQTGFGYVSFEQVMLRVTCPPGELGVRIERNPISFTRARFRQTAAAGFENVNSLLSQSAPYMVDAPRQEKIDNQLHWANRCIIINTRDPSDLAPTDYAYSLSIEPPPDFKY